MDAAVIVDVAPRPNPPNDRFIGALSEASAARWRLAVLAGAGLAVASLTWHAAVGGVGALIATGVLAAIAVGGLARGRPGAAGWVLTAVAIGLAWMSCWRASDWALVTAWPASQVALGALALVCARRVRASRLSEIGPAALEALLAVPAGAVDASGWPRAALGDGAGGEALGAVRGVLVGVPLAAVFVALLSADAAFRDALLALFRGTGLFASWALWAFACAAALMLSGAALLRIRREPRAQAPIAPAEGPYRRVADAKAPVGPARAAPTRAPVRPLTWGLALAQVVAVFGLYAAANARTSFAGHALLRARGTVTYAAYVHEGFVEVSVAALLAVTLVVAGHTLLKPRGAAARTPGGWGLASIELALLGLAALALVSSEHRLALYEQAYGFTTLRLGVRFFQVTIAGLLALTAARSIARGWDGWTTALGWCGVLMAVIVGSFDADRWVVEQSFERARATGAPPDYRYLSTLSEDARGALRGFDGVDMSAYLEQFWRTWAREHQERGWRSLRGVGAPPAPALQLSFARAHGRR